MKIYAATALTLLVATPVLAQADGVQEDTPDTFAAMDVDGNGSVTRAEHAAYVTARNTSQAEAMDEAFTVMDANADGRVDRQEATTVPIIATAFDGLDANKDGGLSRDELQAALVQAQAIEASR